jgi:hypothetical protein
MDLYTVSPGNGVIRHRATGLRTLIDVMIFTVMPH